MQMLVICLYVALVAVSSVQKSVLFDNLVKEAELHYSASGTVLTPEEIVNRVTASLDKASDLLDLDVPVVEGGCEYDFAAFCPKGWVPSGDGIHCEVLPWNTTGDASSGICGRQLDMRDKTPLEKLYLMRMCDLEWPCLKRVVDVPNSDEICPKYWVRQGDECLADPTYMGPCDNRLRLVGKSRSEREELALKCKLSFPRHPELLDENTQWSAKCPLGWLYQESGVCMQIKDQSAGRCGRSLKFNGVDDKREKAKRCGLVWPPNNEDVAEEMVDVDSSVCPLGWRFDPGTNMCFAPSNYTGPCQLRVNFTRYTVEDKALWAHVCGASFIDGGDAPEPPKPSSDITYRNGALDHNLSVVRFGKSVRDVGVMERQLDELNKLRKKSTDSLFLKTLDKSIATLKSHLNSAVDAVSPSFLQIMEAAVTAASSSSMALTNDTKLCPYGWRQFQNICVASETYGRIVPSCRTIRQASDEFGDKCRVAKRDDDPNEDFVRSHCPMGWKTRQVYFDNLVRHLCVAPLDFKESQKLECGGSPMDFSARSPGFKRRWAFACGQRFPNFNDTKAPKCVENFFWRCPSEWTPGTEECVAPKHYAGPCPGSIKLSDIASDIAKADFSRRCYAAWPCVGHCDKYYDQDCPEGWHRDGNGCTLTEPTQVSRCGRNISITKHWTRSHKEELEFLCDVHWPCRKD